MMFPLPPRIRPLDHPPPLTVRTLMAATVLYALLFGLLSWLRVPPVVFAALVLFLTGLVLAQAWLFDGRRPRTASVLFGVAWVGVPLVSGPLLSRGPPGGWSFVIMVNLLLAALASYAIGAVLHVGLLVVNGVNASTARPPPAPSRRLRWGRLAILLILWLAPYGVMFLAMMRPGGR